MDIGVNLRNFAKPQLFASSELVIVALALKSLITQEFSKSESQKFGQKEAAKWHHTWGHCKVLILSYLGKKMKL